MKNDKVFLGIVIIVLFIIPLVLRLLHLHADLPPFSSIGIANGDEGQYANSARNKLLFGVWTVPGDNYYVFHLLPFYTYVLSLFFNVTGVSIVAVKIFSVIFGMGSIILMYIATRRSFGTKVAFIAAFFLAYNFIFMMYNRVGTVETFLVFFLLGAYTLLAYSEKSRVIAFFLGTAVFLAFFAKINGIFIFLPVVLTLLIYHQKNYQLYIYSFSGLAASFLSYVMMFVIPQATVLSSALVKNFILHRLETNLVSSFLPLAYKVLTLGFSSQLFIRMPIVTILSVLSISHLVKKLLSDYREVNRMEFFLLAWIVTQVGVMLLLDASARRIFLLIPPLVILAALAVVNFFEARAESYTLETQWKRGLLFVVNFIFLYMVLGNVIKLFLMNKYGFSMATALFAILHLPSKGYTENVLISVLAAVVSALVVLPLSPLVRSLSLRFQQYSVTAFLKQHWTLIILIGALTFSMIQYGWWYSNPTYTFYQAATEMNALIPPAAIQGRMAPTLTIESRHYPVFIHLDKHINDQNRFKREDIRYFTLILKNELLPLNEQENKQWLAAYPQAKLIKIFHFSDPEFAEVGLFDKYPNSTKTYFYPTAPGR